MNYFVLAMKQVYVIELNGHSCFIISSWNFQHMIFFNFTLFDAQQILLFQFRTFAKFDSHFSTISENMLEFHLTYGKRLS